MVIQSFMTIGEMSPEVRNGPSFNMGCWTVACVVGMSVCLGVCVRTMKLYSESESESGGEGSVGVGSGGGRF